MARLPARARLVAGIWPVAGAGPLRGARQVAGAAIVQKHRKACVLLSSLCLLCWQRF